MSVRDPTKRDLNPACQEFARHYGLAILPARVRKPRDKASVESGVLLVERWILARLRDATFFWLAACVIRAKPVHDSAACRSSIPREVGPRFRRMPVQ